MALKIRADGFPLFFAVGREPGRAGILTLEEVWNEDLVLVGVFAAKGEEIGALVQMVGKADKICARR